MKNIVYVNLISIILCLTIVINNYLGFFLGNNLNEMLAIALLTMLLVELYYISTKKDNKR